MCVQRHGRPAATAQQAAANSSKAARDTAALERLRAAWLKLCETVEIVSARASEGAGGRDEGAGGSSTSSNSSNSSSSSSSSSSNSTGSTGRSSSSRSHDRVLLGEALMAVLESAPEALRVLGGQQEVLGGQETAAGEGDNGGDGDDDGGALTAWEVGTEILQEVRGYLEALQQVRVLKDRADRLDQRSAWLERLVKLSGARTRIAEAAGIGSGGRRAAHPGDGGNGASAAAGGDGGGEGVNPVYVDVETLCKRYERPLLLDWALVNMLLNGRTELCMSAAGERATADTLTRQEYSYVEGRDWTGGEVLAEGEERDWDGSRRATRRAAFVQELRWVTGIRFRSEERADADGYDVWWVCEEEDKEAGEQEQEAVAAGGGSSGSSSGSSSGREGGDE
ncbi:hypothetical protein CHLRE_07g337900v5 [Chlamydomonas reinhardtii]|uniref:Uncharacterized protein n=1 Tax=Chlamydomonas reinhardtii TaxID=3055 RepID=A0A2K3DKA6_CHLRE|nr:uncharacterized protein CHLRE_07g337900v5 [Chlamydomonas reinhardtii]PNW80977.1 hypothetical protein CHLRE_07g337900v5 [Chlamydomonas reinhardtii]